MTTPPEPPATIILANAVSFTVGNDFLTITDDRRARRRRRTRQSCCGLLSLRGAPSSYQIDLYAVLNARHSQYTLVISYVAHHTSDKAHLDILQYRTNSHDSPRIREWTTHLLTLAYGRAQPHKRLKILINPFCTGAAAKYRHSAAPILAAAACQIDLEQTQYRGHAGLIAEHLEPSRYDAVVCCSGDGLPHEVFNGLARRPDAVRALTSLAVAMLPCGSGNAMAWNLLGTGSVARAALAIVKGVTLPLDLMSVTQGDAHSVSFLSQSLGVLAESDLRTEHLRWMGDSRFLLGVVQTIARQTAFPCELAFKTASQGGGTIPRHFDAGATLGSSEPTAASFAAREAASEPGKARLVLKYGTVQNELPPDWAVISGERLASFYASKMAIVAKDTQFFPAALPNDGLLDVMTIDETIGYAGAVEAIVKLPGGRCYELDKVHMRKVLAYRLSPRASEGWISVDGERYPFEPFQVEVHQGLGRVLARSLHTYQV
ncbi:uncharacterized protein BO95DRAFT_497904 [Aspergillus brunneoviolaceus CBS 621.78]|uniref:Uncharacterized protein n=1 Tax=Aspergillus brunneoviolaceus CBS 621.78 TaxID=1450534 RepID=A0ACD1GMF5_9EURO|nr:hypothetical protein BO95DRAFT_497904 [Aspergillus brunneoviolaceus CBS 621.78]RAH50534.1 hypothetical protein BO95DRAFT_497904 [Aspergillus brunneoviolaceus CBS 621.78]